MVTVTRMGLSAAYSERETGVLVESDIEAAVALMTVRGSWDPPLWKSATIAVQKCLAEHPEALIIDLSGLDDPKSASAPTWLTAQRSAAHLDPPMQVALCVPPHLPLADKMQRLGSRRFLPVYAKVRQARVAIASRRPLTERLVLPLEPGPDAPSLARNLVSDACLAWGMTDMLHGARMVMSELVTNALEHAGTPMTVVVSRRGSGLHMAVADESAVAPRIRQPARPRPGEPLDDRGHGLLIVGAVATIWSSMPTPTGKVVWAVLTPGHEDRPVVSQRRHRDLRAL
jgi:hypothetical protein